MSQPHATPAPNAAQATKETVKDTLISVIIAFVLAFVFRGFVVEAFVIPTGSMAPTLMGAHMQFRGDQSGYDWSVGPWDPNPRVKSEYLSPQGVNRAIEVQDPMSGRAPGGREQRSVPLKSGDRILVLKYLYEIVGPKRFDVVVFKYPGEPGTNYIKRLLGLAGQQTALVDGDVFYRIPTGDSRDAATLGLWKDSGWRIARKPRDAAETLWQPIFDSDFTPENGIDASNGRRWFTTPWRGEGSGWQIEDRRSFAYDGTGSGLLRWDEARPAPMSAFAGIGQGPVRWEISDRYAYNQGPLVGDRVFPVSDVRLRAGVEVPSASKPITVTTLLKARGHEFRGTLDGSTSIAKVEMRPAAGAGGTPDAPWRELGAGTFAGLTPGTVTNIEFWHLDQSVALYVNGRKVTDRGSYGDEGPEAWTPAKRFEFATGRTLEEVAANPGTAVAGAELADPSIYRKPQVSLTLSGAANLHRVAVDRDIHYQPCARGPGRPGWATHPLTTVTLAGDQYFVCGDNSPASADGRLWDPSDPPRGNPDPWVKTLTDPTVGIVPRDLMLGKAFFVYFPALSGTNPIPMPDFGRLRFIR
ncbi:MAG: S26 family signal peptidase [Phycisphaerales bacterium]